MTIMHRIRSIEPTRPQASTARVVLGISFFVLFVAAWSSRPLAASSRKTFLANPWTMLQDGWLLLTKHGFLHDIGMTIWRVIGGFVLAAHVRGAASAS
jgi:NitT/TauT family transport system permease protein